MVKEGKRSQRSSRDLNKLSNSCKLGSQGESREELMDCSRMWEPQHSSRKQESGYLEKGGFELDFKGLSHQEGNEICPWLMENKEGKILQDNTQ